MRPTPSRPLLLAAPGLLGIVLLGIGLLGVGPLAFRVSAQPESEEGGGRGGSRREGNADDEDWDEEEEDWGDEEGGGGTGLRPPSAEQLDLGSEEEGEGGEGEEGGGAESGEGGEEESGEGEGEGGDDDDLPSPGEDSDRLDDGVEPTLTEWSRPQTVFQLHGYMRMRGEFQDNFFLGDARVSNPDYAFPFELFRPAEDGETGLGRPCGTTTAADGTPIARPCDQNAMAFANMRLRLEPSIHLSEDVRVRMQLDLFDNMVLGSTPAGFSLSPGAGGVYTQTRSPFVPLYATNYHLTQQPPSYPRNSLTDSIVARRAWAEVRNRGLGELRFGRMGSHWGLGILQNGGRGIDSDYQTDVDRVMISTRLAGIYLFGAWDFAAEGYLRSDIADVGGVAYDASRLDDVDQIVVGAAYRATEEERAEALQRGDVVFNAGAYFMYRSQNLSFAGTQNPWDPDAEPIFFRRGAEIFIPDLWLQFYWDKLRLEFEGAFIYGNVANNSFDSDGGTNMELLQFGFAFEGEYHLLNDQLGIYFNAGYATGDRDVEGLTQRGGLNPQIETPGGTDRTDSTFYFHPNYRIDLIFWRNVMRQFGGAYYFRPGLSYDFIRDPFGQLLGARADVVWSRASEPVQAPGNTDDLGVEIDISLYYRSDDGPDLLDGFYAMAQYGIFFPLDGLNIAGSPVSMANAQTFRVVLGVQY